MAFLDDAGLVKLWQHIQTRLSNKVDKVAGKGLSSNDFTDEDKEKLASLKKIPLNADTLGGISASEYVLKSDLENINLTNVDAASLGSHAASEYALKFENWSDEEKTALVEYVFSALTNANGVIF